MRVVKGTISFLIYGRKRLVHTIIVDFLTLGFVQIPCFSVMHNELTFLSKALQGYNHVLLLLDNFRGDNKLLQVFLGTRNFYTWKKNATREENSLCL
jgi:hypothetical protein